MCKFSMLAAEIANSRPDARRPLGTPQIDSAARDRRSWYVAWHTCDLPLTRYEGSLAQVHFWHFLPRRFPRVPQIDSAARDSRNRYVAWHTSGLPLTRYEGHLAHSHFWHKRGEVAWFLCWGIENIRMETYLNSKTHACVYKGHHFERKIWFYVISCFKSHFLLNMLNQTQLFHVNHTLTTFFLNLIFFCAFIFWSCHVNLTLKSISLLIDWNWT